jgi:hypothetical protein
MSWWWLLVVVLLACALLIEGRSSRPDGELIRVHPYRRLMFFIMPRASESVVYFDATVDCEALLTYLKETGEAFGGHMTHAVVAACGKGLAENPSMNRFVAGGRLYQRRGRFVTFSMKRKKLDKAARLAVVKEEIRDADTFRTLCERLNQDIDHQRSGKRTAADKEFSLFNALPGTALRLLVPAVMWANHRNLLPSWFMASDAMFTSVVVANLGSLKMGAGYHHLYEWGTCPLFVMVGQVEEAPRIVDGAVVPRKQLHLRFTYDERIDDGLTARFGIESVVRVLSNPRTELGCVPGEPDIPLVAQA